MKTTYIPALCVVWAVSAVLFALAILAGAGTWMLENLTPLLNDFFGSVATLFGLSVTLHILLLLPNMLLHRVVSKVTGVDVR